MRKRRNFSKAQLLNHLNGQRESGQAAVHYCATQGLCKSTFFRWRKVHQKSLESDLGKFIELIPPGVQARNSIVEIELPSSCTLRFYQGANNALISEIIRGL
jgi:hypothetical protein